MIKNGFKLFTTTGQIAEKNQKYKYRTCCSICTSPYIGFCTITCKYRNATYGEFIEVALMGG